jgi:hypothetical protein
MTIQLSARGFDSRETDKKSERNECRKNRRHERAWRGCAHTAVAVLTKLGCKCFRYFCIGEAPPNVVAVGNGTTAAMARYVDLI